MRDRRIPESERAEIVTRYEQGHAQAAVAEHFGRASSSIYSILLAAGIPIRANGKARTLERRTVMVDGRKTCARCKQAKELDEFTPDKQGVAGRASRCRTCQREVYAERMQDPAWRANRQQRYAARMQDPAKREDKRERQRFQTERARREAGIPERKWGPRHNRGQGGANPRIPAAPMQEAIEHWLNAAPHHTKEELARRMGLNGCKRVTDLLQQASVTRSVADRACVAIGLHLDVVYAPRRGQALPDARVPLLRTLPRARDQALVDLHQA